MHDDPIAEAIQDGEVPQRTPEELRRALEEVLRTKEGIVAAKKSYLEDAKGRIRECDIEISSLLQQLKQ